MGDRTDYRPDTGVLSHFVFIQLLGLSFPTGFLFE